MTFMQRQSRTEHKLTGVRGIDGLSDLKEVVVYSIQSSFDRGKKLFLLCILQHFGII